MLKATYVYNKLYLKMTQDNKFKLTSNKDLFLLSSHPEMCQHSIYYLPDWFVFPSVMCVHVHETDCALLLIEGSWVLCTCWLYRYHKGISMLLKTLNYSVPKECSLLPGQKSNIN